MRKKLYDYHIDDARKINEKIKKSIVDVTITSPPYWDLKNYGIKNQIGYKQNYEEYLEDLKGIFGYISDITKDTGSLWIIIDTFKKNGEIKALPFDLAEKIKNWWKLQDIIIWYKDKTLPWSHKGKLRNIFEYILFFTKRDGSNFKYYVDRIKDPDDLKGWWIKYPERYNPKGKTPTRVWWYEPIPIQGSWGNGRIHFCPFPPEFVERILLLTTDEKDVVLDPFAGSGAVLAQAKVMKRKPIGFDINDDYRRIYENKILPLFKLRWKNRKKELKNLEKKRKIFEVTVKNLRQLKYPKELVKRSSKTGFFEDIDSNLNTVFLLNNENNWNTPTIYFIFDGEVNKEKILLNFNKVSGKPPLSKYGINADIEVCDKNTFLKNRDNLGMNEDLFLYSKGITNYYKQKITFSEWAQINDKEDWENHFKDIVPPILSNLGVNQRDPNLKV